MKQKEDYDAIQKNMNMVSHVLLQAKSLQLFWYLLCK